jgi:hypothetical protein
MTATRIFLGLSVLVWLGYGAYCFFVPETLTEAAGLVASTPTALTEIRAMYGGLQMALGVIALLGLLREDLVRPALFSLATVATGLFSTRLIGAVIDSAFSEYTNGALGFEFIASASAIVLFLKAERPN